MEDDQNSDSDSDSMDIFSAMMSAARDGDLDTLKQLVAHGKFVGDIDQNTGYTLLHHAVVGGDTRCLEFLLQHADTAVNAWAEYPSRSRKTALHLAMRVEKNPLPLVMLLIDHGADVNVLCYRGRSSFHDACAYSTPDVVTFLLGKQPTLLTQPARRHMRISFPQHWTIAPTAVHPRHLSLPTAHPLQVSELGHAVAIAEGNVSVLKALIDFETAAHPGDSQLSLQNGIQLACKAAGFGRLDALKIIFERFGHLLSECGNGYKIMCKAVRQAKVVVQNSRRIESHKKCICFLLEQGCKPYYFDTAGNLSFKIVDQCVEKCFADIFSQLLHSIPASVVCLINLITQNPAEIVDNLLGRAVQQNNAGALKALMERGFVPPKIVNTTAHDMFMHPELEAITDENKFNFPLNLRMDFLGYAIIEADRQFLPNIVSLLLNYHKQESKRDGFSALFYFMHRAAFEFTCSEQMLSVFDMLLDAGEEICPFSSNDKFSCSDLVLIAALSGNGVLLANAILKTSTKAPSLIADLAKLEIPADFSGDGQKRLLRNVIGHAVETVLQFTISSAAGVKDACELVDNHFPAPIVATAHVSSTWDNVRSSLERVSSLQHMCRVTIYEWITSVKGQISADYAKAIERASFPVAIERYLSFADVLASRSTYATQASDRRLRGPIHPATAAVDYDSETDGDFETVAAGSEESDADDDGDQV